MQKLTRSFSTLLTAAVLSTASAVQATVVETGDPTTFLDQSTGLTWMKVNQFWNMTYSQVEAALAGTSYRMATLDEVQALTLSAGDPATHDDYVALAIILGGAYDGGLEPWGREIIWGIIDNGPSAATALWGWHWCPESGAGGWYFEDQGYGKEEPFLDLGAWVVQNGGVPDVGSSLALLGGALALMGAVGRKSRR